MLKETETEETIVSFVTFLSLVAFQLGKPRPPAPPPPRWLHLYTLVTLLRPWIKRLTTIISAWWLRTSIKFNGQEFEEIRRSIGSMETFKQVRISPSTK